MSGRATWMAIGVSLIPGAIQLYLLVSAFIGAWQARPAFLFDDAFVFSRYADHLLAGYGLATGKKEDLPGVLVSGHCALVTLREDMLGVMSPSKMHACLAMGLPILYVGPQGSNVDQAVQRFGCGISLRNRDAAGLAASVRKLRDSLALRAELGRKARQAFEQAYSDGQVLPRFDALLEELSAGRA